MAIRVSDLISSDSDVELQDMSRYGDYMDDSTDVIDIVETSFIDTRSGQKYEKLFVIKKVKKFCLPESKE